jgi:hypothetical protein
MISDMMAIFNKANSSFLEIEANDGIHLGVSERSLCGSLMLHLRKALDESAYGNYFVDIEYNRNEGGKLKTIVNECETPVTITCDLIVHSRGKIVSQDNLIAIEMKRSTHPQGEKDKDRLRLSCLTRDSYDNIWSYDGKTLPEHVCRYILGVYYELDSRSRKASVEYYVKGRIERCFEIAYPTGGDTE